MQPWFGCFKCTFKKLNLTFYSFILSVCFFKYFRIEIKRDFQSKLLTDNHFKQNPWTKSILQTLLLNQQCKTPIRTRLFPNSWTWTFLTKALLESVSRKSRLALTVEPSRSVGTESIRATSAKWSIYLVTLVDICGENNGWNSGFKNMVITALGLSCFMLNYCRWSI